MKFTSILMALLLTAGLVVAQNPNDGGYRTPPKVLQDMIDTPPTPSVSLSPDNSTMVLLTRASYPPISQLAEEELRLGGLRINPKTNGPSRRTPIVAAKIKDVATGAERDITGLPSDLRVLNAAWSPNGKYVAVSNETDEGIELWVVDVAAATARRVVEPVLNDAVGGSPFSWFSDNNTLLVRTVVPDRGMAPKRAEVPSSPVIQDNSGGTLAQARTYQDLLQSKEDEQLFEYYATSVLWTYNIAERRLTKLTEPGIYTSCSPSPDGNYIMVEKVKRPFSYLVPYSRFASEIQILNRDGSLQYLAADKPLNEAQPISFDAVEEGARRHSWRNDAPATLVYQVAVDGGDPRVESEYRDEIFMLAAPFKGVEPVSLVKGKYRFFGITWGNDGLAMVTEAWISKRHLRQSWINPSTPGAEPRLFVERSYQDRYADPGSPELTQNQYGEYVMLFTNKGKNLMFTGSGASDEGDRPFLRSYDIKSGEFTELWRSEAPYYEYVVTVLDEDKGQRVMTRREAVDMPPNYYVRDLKKGEMRQVTTFGDPTPQLRQAQKQQISYEREDGVTLTATLYTPAGWSKEDGPLPMLMWAYPNEFKDASAASQVSGSPYTFDRISWASPLFWLARGYAVLDDAGMPVIGEGDDEPNDTFIPQLVANAKAAIDKVVAMGVVDRNRVAVGGHSYGAFMTANLLTHSDLFAAGIARSGAYNRTLTPFGFQAEQRTFWEAKDVYGTMSPFFQANMMKTPLLLIHGQADNNSGTYPMQSERYYAALKGHGAPVRLVMLPYESHGYQARESILHMLWEMDSWLETHVKNRTMDSDGGGAAGGGER